MSKVETYQQAWSLALKGDFSLVDQIYHPEYRSLLMYLGYPHLKHECISEIQIACRKRRSWRSSRSRTRSARARPTRRRRRPRIQIGGGSEGRGCVFLRRRERFVLADPANDDVEGERERSVSNGVWCEKMLQSRVPR